MPFVKGGVKLSHDIAGWWESRRSRGPRDRSWGRTAAAAATIVAMVLGLVGTVVVAAPVSATAAAVASSCSFANAGRARTPGLCAGSTCRPTTPHGRQRRRPEHVGGPAGRVFDQLHPEGVGRPGQGHRASRPTAAPTWATAPTPVSTGKPALYQTQSGTTTTAALSGISVVDSQGNPVTGYSFVGADAESTDTGESITWASDQPLSLISNIGNACNSGALLTGVGTTTVKCSATVSSTKTGTAILAAEAPLDVLADHGRRRDCRPWRSASLVSTVQLNKTVASRINPSDAFASTSPRRRDRCSVRPTRDRHDRFDRPAHRADQRGGRELHPVGVGHVWPPVGLQPVVVVHPQRRHRPVPAVGAGRPVGNGDAGYRRLRQLHHHQHRQPPACPWSNTPAPRSTSTTTASPTPATPSPTRSP